MKGAGLTFLRRGIGTWEDIWLRAAGPQYDMVGGGITILASRTLDAAGGKAVVFTSGHVVFRQSLLVRAEDAGRIRGHGDLGGARVGVLAGTTGEARLLVLVGLANSAGVLAAGCPRPHAARGGGRRRERGLRHPRLGRLAPPRRANLYRAALGGHAPGGLSRRETRRGGALGGPARGAGRRGGAGRNRQSRRGPRLGRRVRGHGPGSRGSSTAASPSPRATPPWPPASAGRWSG